MINVHDTVNNPAAAIVIDPFFADILEFAAAPATISVIAIFEQATSAEGTIYSKSVECSSCPTATVILADRNSYKLADLVKA